MRLSNTTFGKKCTLRHLISFTLIITSCLGLFGQSVEVLEKGRIIDTIRCDYDSDFSYALYLPNNYNEEEQFPIIYIFDPAARGYLPLKHMRYAAELYGYILVSSNNSRNGPWENNLEAMDHLSFDVKRRLKIDPNAQYLCGFSGGSRFASYLAMSTEEYKGVIGCGAGFSNIYPPTSKMDFSYVGIIGIYDSFYYEMKILDKSLEVMGKDHLLLKFNKGHDWPDSLTFELAFRFMEMADLRHNRKMKKWEHEEFQKDYQSLIQVNSSIIDSYKQSMLIEKIYHASFNDSIFKNKLHLLKVDKKVKNYNKKQLKLLMKEKKLQDEYHQQNRNFSMRSHDADMKIEYDKWWKIEVKHWTKASIIAKNIEERQLAFRMIHFLERQYK